MKYSIIVLLDQVNEDFSEFIETLFNLFVSKQEPFEILIAANGTDGFLTKVMKENAIFSNREIRAFALSSKTSQATCLKALFKESSGEIIIVNGPYQQITLDSFRQLLGSLDSQTDIISCWRQKRVDPFFNQLQSNLFNALVRKITKTSLNDLNCTVRVMRRRVIEETEFYGDMYRFLPIFAERKGLKCKEIKCEHFQERGKTGFYSLSEYINRILDIFTLYFNTRFTRKPLRFFSIIGAIFLMIGILMTLYVFGDKLIFGNPIGNRFLLISGIVFMIFGVQAASVGLLGEIIVFTHGRHKKEYVIEKII